MKNKDGCTIFRIEVPKKTIVDFQGEAVYEETLEDHLMYGLCEPIRVKQLSFKIDYNAFELQDGFGIEIVIFSKNVEDDLINENSIEDRLRKGLIISRLKYGEWVHVYNDSN